MIDDEVVGRLEPGEARTFEVTTGSHEVYVRLYWCRSEKVDVHLSGNQEVNLRCETRANLLTDGYWATLGRRRYLRLIRVGSPGDAQSNMATERERIDSISVADGERSRKSPRGEGHQTPRSVNALRRRQPVPAVVLLAAVGILSFAITRGVDFLTGISIIAIGVQAVIAVNFHFLAPRFTSEPGTKSNEPFGFRIVEESIISAAFVLAGILSLTGVLHVGEHAGWLAVAAAAAGIANIVATRRVMTAAFDKPR
ncbi:MAG TPA: hypothetical protein VFP23_08405 [Solirubrobacterales bacterium]|nr:hypothetical protein [Solirubrobacterales bacterium]